LTLARPTSFPSTYSESIFGHHSVNQSLSECLLRTRQRTQTHTRGTVPANTVPDFGSNTRRSERIGPTWRPEGIRQILRWTVQAVRGWPFRNWKPTLPRFIRERNVLFWATRGSCRGLIIDLRREWGPEQSASRIASLATNSPHAGFRNGSHELPNGRTRAINPGSVSLKNDIALRQ
jgi:hypothetical protein